MTELNDAHVLVIGATGGLGTAISKALAQAGATVTVAGRDADKVGELAGQLGDRAAGQQTIDVTEPGFAPALLEAAAQAAPLTGVVYAAGVVAFGPIGDLEPEVLGQLVAVNFAGPIQVAAAAATRLPEGGFLANLSAVVAEMPMKNMAAYSATKAGVTGFDRALATELRRSKIKVLDVRPPHTETGLVTRALAGTPPRLAEGLSPEQVADRVVRAIAEDTGELASTSFTQ